MAEVDARIPLEVQTPTIDFAGDMSNALSIKGQQQTIQSNQQTLSMNDMKLSQMQTDAQDNAKMSIALNGIDPNDPDYDTKAISALTRAGVSPTKVLDFKATQIKSQAAMADVELKKAQTKESQQKQIDQADENTFKNIDKMTSLIGDVTGDVVRTYDNIMAKGGPNADSTATAAANTLWTGHLGALMSDPSLPDKFKKMVEEKLKEPFDINKIQSMYATSKEHSGMIEDRKAREASAKTNAETQKDLAEAEQHIPAQAELERAQTREADAKARKADAEAKMGVTDTMDPKEREVIANLAMLSPQSVRGTKVSIADRNANVKALVNDPDNAHKSGKQIAEMFISGQGGAKADIAAEKAFDSGKQGDTVRSLNVATQHLDTISGLAKDLKNKDYKAANIIKNTLAAQAGKPAVTNFQEGKQIVADEVMKAVVGSGAGGEADRQNLQAAFSEANSPDQLQGVVDTAQELMTGQIKGLREQFMSSGVGDPGEREKRFNQKLDPRTLQAEKRADARVKARNEKQGGNVRMSNPKTGKIYDIPKSELDNARAHGLLELTQ